MDQLYFGTGGIPNRLKPRGSTIDGINCLADLGLGCMEIEFVQRVNISDTGAREVAKVAAERGTKLSAHAPYYINLNSHEPDKVQASQARLLNAARIGALCGAQTVNFHAGFYLGDPPDVVYSRIKERVQEVTNELRKENNHICLRPEVMGKESEFGSLDDVIRLCSEVEGVAPGIDFAHMHARNGAVNSYAEFAAVLEKVRERLGRASLENIHIHLSGIRYGKKGEISHLNLKDSDLRYVELLQALKDFAVKGLVICESPSLEEDALLLKKTYEGLGGGR